MGQTQTIDPVEVIKSNAIEARKVSAQCRWKAQVLKEMFEAMSDQNPIQFDDHVSCFLGVMTICSEISDQLVEVESTFDIVKKHADFCSPDPEKLKAYEEEQEKMEEDLLSMGIEPAANKGLKPPVTTDEMLEEENHDIL
jgi:hypothetical protein